MRKGLISIGLLALMLCSAVRMQAQFLCPSLTWSDLPYFEDFESYGYGRDSAISPCWHKGMTVLSGTVNVGALNYPYSERVNIGNDTVGLWFVGYQGPSSSYSSWAALPRLDDSVDVATLELFFMVKLPYYQTAAQVVVGVADSVTTDFSIVPVDTIDLSTEPVNSLHPVYVTFENYTGNGKYIVFQAPAPPADSTSMRNNAFYLDNVTLRRAASCPTTQGVIVTRATADSVFATWPDDNNVDSWLVYVGSPGFNIDTATPEYVSSSNAGIGRLRPNTDYELMVVASCSGNDGYPSYPAPFRTLCAPLDTLPFVEDFEGPTGYSYTSASVNNLPPCWWYYNTGTDYQYQGYPIVYNNPSSAHGGNNSLRFLTSSASGGLSGEFTPQFAIMPLTDPVRYPITDLQVSFWMRNHTSAPSNIVVGVMSDPYDTSTFIPVRTVSAIAANYSVQYTVGFANYAGPHGHVAFKAPFGDYNANNPSIDDVTLEVMPIACATITAIRTETTASAAHLTWDYNIEFGTPTGFNVLYRHADDTTGTVVNTYSTEPELLLTGFDADTDYWVSVAADCSGLYGAADTIIFRTQALPCVELDTANIPEDTLTLGIPGTGTNAMFPVSATTPSSRVQHLFLASEIPVSGPTTLKGIGFEYAYTMTAGYASNCSIYMAHTTRDSMTNSFDGSQQQLVYTGSLAFSEPGWNYVLFNQGFFEYDGVSNLCVTIEKNSGNTANSNFTFRHETTARPMTCWGGRPRPVGAWTMSSVGSTLRSNTRLITSGDVYCGRWASCLPPVVHLDTIAEGNYRLWWIPGYQETSWDVDYRQADSTTWINALSETTHTYYTFSTSALGLEPNVRYEFRVKANCSDSTDTAASVFLITPCAYMDIPFSYGFEGLPTGSTTVPLDIHCWFHLNDAPTYNGIPFVHSFAHTGNRGLIFSTSVAQTNYGSYQGVVLPRVDTATNPIHTLHLSFWARPGGNYDDPILYVGVMTDPADITTFQYVDTIEIDNTSTAWQLYEADFDSYTGTGEYIAIRANRPETGGWSAYVDDINVNDEGICHRVRDIVVRNITPNSATISWSRGGLERAWEIVVGDSVYYSRDTFYTVRTVDSNTYYNVSVRAICGEGDTSIPWTSYFRTPCYFLSDLPYFNDLESEPYYHVPVVYRPDAFPLCWVRLIDPPNATNDSPHIVNSYNLYRIHGNNSLYWEINYSRAHNQYAILPPVDLSVYDMRDLTLAFYAKKISNSDAPFLQFIVGVMDNNTDSSTFVPVDTVTPTRAITLHRVDFASYTGTGNYIAICCPRTTYDREAAIDDIFLTDHWCELPTNLHASASDTSVTVHWDGNGDSSFTVILGTDTVRGITDTFYTFTGLQESTLYYYSVAGECSGSRGMFVTDSIQTECHPLTLRDLPYFEDFETYGYGAEINPCWHKGVTFTSGIPYLLDQPRLNTMRIGTDTVGLTLHGYNSDASSYYSWVALPRLEDTLDVSRLEVDFLVIRPETTTQPLIQLVVGIATDIYTDTTFVPVDTIDLTNEPLGSLHSVAVRFEHYTGNGKYVVFMAPVPPADSTATHYTIYNSFGIDNITLRVANPCPTPQHVGVTRTTADSVYVTWVPAVPGDTNVTGWVVYIGAPGADISTFTPHQVTGTAVGIGNLNPDTDYELVVAASCSGTQSFTTYPVQFHTLCAPLDVLPFVEDFESTAGYSYPHASVNNLPHCWLYHNTGTEFSYRGFPIVHSDASYAHRGSNAIGFMTSNSPGPYSDQIAIMPLTDSILYPVSTLQVSFWMRSYHYYYQSFIVVGVMNDYADSSTFVPVDTFYTHASTTYAHHAVAFSNYTGPHGHVAFKAPMSSISSNQPYIDDIVLEVLCPGIENLHVAHATLDTLTIVWAGSGTDYEVAIKAVTDTVWPTATAVADTTYTFIGLMPETEYLFRVRQDCSADTLGRSRWMTGTFTTDRRPCFAPDSLTVADITNATATFSWIDNPSIDASVWNLRVYNNTFDTLYTGITTRPVTVSGLTADVTYSAAVRALCGENANIEGFWSDTLQFTTLVCPNVTGVDTGVVTFNSVTLIWDTAENAVGYEVEYGMGGFTQGNGTLASTPTNSLTVTGLLPETLYDFYIRAVCGTDWQSESWSPVVTATTLSGPEGIEDRSIGNSQVSIFPNPATHSVAISVNGVNGKVRITVVSIDGRMVASETLECHDGCVKTMDVDNLCSGTYFVRITGEQVHLVKKLIVRN